ncbi:hypothetical protein, partial [Enterobacter hormaechei]|uniref:hypothetical protein n=1 Tax=Enterobacter hormaechei TaxID=158836 RepID=UPI00403AEC99
FIVGGPVGDFELLLCHGTVCVVGKMRDLILQLSKSSIYSTKPLLGYLVAELLRGYVADSSPYVPGLSYSQFSMLMVVELCLCFLAWFLVVTGDYPRPWIFQVVPMEQYWFFDEVDDDDLARLSCNPYIKRWLLDEMSGIHRLTYTRLHDRLERICNIASHLEYSRIQAHKISLINGSSAS